MASLTRLAFALALAVSLPVASSRAQDCTGDPGFELAVLPPIVEIGASFNECLTTPPGDWNAFLLVSFSTGTTPSVVGDLCVGLPFVAMFLLQMPPEGQLCLADRQLPCDPSLIGVVAYFQFVAVSTTLPKTFGISNLASLTVTDGPCNHPCDVEPGDFVTYTQGGWGVKCTGNNPGCLRDANFPGVFPGGLVIGDQDGPDADGDHALLLTTSKAVQDFLPEGTTPGTLDADVTDVANCSAGVFAGQLVAATINVAFDDAGVFDPFKNQVAVKLGDLVFVSGVNAKLLGLTVREVIDLSNLAISGALPEPIDVDGDMLGDVLLSDLSSALDQVNMNFDNGTANNGVLCKP